MLNVSQAYKRDIRQNLRNRSYMEVAIGVINQDAQTNAYVDTTTNKTLWISDNEATLTSYNFEAYYATAEQDFTSVDGRMYFAPANASSLALTQGSVSQNILGPITINFGGLAYDLRGITIDFGKNYPTSFEIWNGSTLEATITGNTLSNYIYDGVIFGCRTLTINPLVMSGGHDRLRILKFTSGIGITFDNTTIMDSKRSQYVSPLSEDLPSIDFSLTVDNSHRTFDIENDSSTINYFETGQDVRIRYGYTLDNGTVEWLDGGNLILTGWKADDAKMSLTAVDRWTSLNTTEYYKGKLYTNGRTLYQLAVDVFTDAGLESTEYYIDPYLQGITVYNPLPVCTHAEAIQYIANAGRCIMTQDVDGVLIVKHSFAAKRLPDMTVSCNAQNAYSSVENILSSEPKYHYAIANEDLVTPDGDFTIRPETATEKLYTGYFTVSACNANGYFPNVNPIITINLEASYVAYGLHITFGGNHPLHQVIRTYLNNTLVQTHSYDIDTNEWSTNDEFAEFDKIVIEIDRACPNNHVFIDYVGLGDTTDYTLTYSQELSAYPTGEKIEKIKSIDQVIYTYTALYETKKELYKETLDVTGTDVLTMTLNNPSYNLSATINGNAATVLASGAYYLAIQIPSNVTGLAEIEIIGNEYVVNEQDYFFAINDVGKTITYTNPLVSTESLAYDLVEWEGDYNFSDRVYSDLDYRGDPRLEANDLVLLENKYIDQCFLRIIECDISFGGGLSGKINARRDLSANGAFAGRIARLKANTTTADHAATADYAEQAELANEAASSSDATFTVKGAGTTQLKLKTTNYENAFVRARDTGNTYGSIMQIQSGGNMIIGSGEFANSLYNGSLDDSASESGESLYLGSDGTTRIYSNGNTIANRKTWHYDTAGSINLPDGTAKIAQDGNILLNTAAVTGWLSTLIYNLQTLTSSITPSRTNNSSTGIAATSIVKSTNTNGGSFTLAKGLYIVTVSARWNSNATGSRQVWLSTTATGGGMSYNDISIVQAVNGAVTHQQFTSFLAPTASTTYNIVLHHTSTVDVTCTTRYSIIRLSSG